MVKKEKSALQALHLLIIKGRMMAWENNSTQLFEFLDELEYLPALMLEEENQSKMFEEYLEAICIKRKCPEVYHQFKHARH